MRSTILLAALLGAAGCNGKQPPSVVEPPGDVTVGAVPPPSETATAAATSTASPTETVAPDATVLLGVVGQTGIQLCVNQEEKWFAVRPTIGFVGVSGSDAALEALMDEPVLAQGKQAEAPAVSNPPPATGEICPPMQMRSDWILTPRGIKRSRGDHPLVGHFAIEKVRRLTELKVARSGDQLEVTFQNPLPWKLSEVEITMHYEGCYGKPGTKTKRESVATLAPGQRHLWKTLALLVEDSDSPRARGGKARYRASSVQIAAQAQRTIFDLDASVHKLGAEVDCPRD